MSDYFYLAPSLVALRDEINAMFPHRDKTSDGWIGDPAHAARPSDHNPDYSAGGVVRAIDIDIDDHDQSKDLVQIVLKATIGDPRVWYVIHNGKIYSRTYGWVARTYTGTNPHKGHIHVSIVHTKAAETDRTKWLDPVVKVILPAINVEAVRNQFRIGVGAEKGRLAATPGVRKIQRLLNEKYKTQLKIDGLAGKATCDAYAIHEHAMPATKRHGYARVPDRDNLAVLVRGRYRLT